MTKIDFRSNPPLDSFVLLDASILLALFTPVREASGAINHSLYKAHNDVLSFLSYVVPQVTNGNVLLVTLDLAIEECTHHIVTKGIDRDMGAGGSTRLQKAQTRYRQMQARSSNRTPATAISAVNLYKFDARVIRDYLPIVHDFIAAVRALPIAILTPAELQGIGALLPEQMLAEMKRYDLLAADAYYLAVARNIGISTVATVDKDWLRAKDDFTILINR